MSLTPKDSTSRTLSLLASTSLLAPLAGLAVSPILAHAFSPTNRGILAAAIAPAVLMLSVATFGLPEALTYFCAKYRWQTRTLLLKAAGLTLTLWVILLGLTILFLQILSKGNDELASLIILASLVIAPALLVNLLRGAAVGLHAWRVVALERACLAFGRVAAFGTLYLTGHLTLTIAVIVSLSLPAAAGLVYLNVCLFKAEQVGAPKTETVSSPIFVRYGLRVWLGSIASILLARVDQLLMTPLASAYDLGIYTIAVTISEIPMAASAAVQSGLFGMNSKERDAQKLALVGRLFFIVAVIGCVAIGTTLSSWISILFGRDYRDAVQPALLLLLGTVIVIPGTSAGTALNAWDKPNLRSISLVLTLMINLTLLFILVPRFGVYGACFTSIIGSVVYTGLLLKFASKVTGLQPSAFFLPRGEDFRELFQRSRAVVQKIIK